MKKSTPTSGSLTPQHFADDDDLYSPVDRSYQKSCFVPTTVQLFGCLCYFEGKNNLFFFLPGGAAAAGCKRAGS